MDVSSSHRRKSAGLILLAAAAAAAAALYVTPRNESGIALPAYPRVR